MKMCATNKSRENETGKKTVGNNKVAIYQDTRALLDELNERTKIPRAKLVKDAVKKHARKLLTSKLFDGQ